jgi:hypothetical protein
MVTIQRLFLFLAIVGLQTGMAQIIDVSIMDIPEPPAVVSQGDALLTKALVANIGKSDSPVGTITFTITDSTGSILYGPDEKVLPSIVANPAQIETITASSAWTPATSGKITITVECQVEGDEYLPNNKMEKTITVEPVIITRSQAIALVENQVLLKSPYRNQLVAYLYGKTETDSVLSAGDIVSPLDSAFTEILDKDTYFFWINNEPNKEWYHASTFVFVNANTGAFFSYNAQSWPVVNGQEIKFTENERIRGELNAGPLNINYTPQTTQNISEGAIILVGKNQDGIAEKHIRKNDIARLEYYLNAFTKGPQIDNENIVTVAGNDTLGASLVDFQHALDQLRAKNCYKLTLAYLGPGNDNEFILRNTPNRSQKIDHVRFGVLILNYGFEHCDILFQSSQSGPAVQDVMQTHYNLTGQPIYFKGVVISASDSKNASTRQSDGSVFIKSMFMPETDDRVDLNQDGILDLTEAFYQAENTTPQFNQDGAFLKTLTDNRYPTASVPQTQTIAGLSDSVQFSINTYSYFEPGSRFKQRRSFLYVQNLASSPYRGESLDIICIDEQNNNTILSTFQPLLTAHEERFLLELDSHCEKLKIKTSANNPQSTQTHARPINLLSSGHIYNPNEAIFDDIFTVTGTDENYNAILISMPDWPVRIAPNQFVTHTLADTEYVFLKGMVPDSAQSGGQISSRLINQTTGDTLDWNFNALVHHRMDNDLASGYRYNHLDILTDTQIQTGITDFMHTILNITENQNNTISKDGTLLLDHSVFKPNQNETYDIHIEGTVNWKSSMLLSPAKGLRLEPLAATIHKGGVFYSQENGLNLSGSQNKTFISHFISSHAQKNGLYFNNADSGVFENIRIENAQQNDVALENGSDVTMVDCFYDDQKVMVDETSRLKRSWSTSFVFLNDFDEPLPGTILEIKDATNTVVATDTIGPTGFSETFSLAQYTQTGSGRTFLTPHELVIRYGERDTTILYMADQYFVGKVILPGSFTPVEKEEKSKQPAKLNLCQNYPNPFNPTTTIQLELPKKEDVRLSIYNLLGQKVTTLVETTLDAGYHQFEWNASGMASGTYLYQLETGNSVQTKKLLLLE